MQKHSKGDEGSSMMYNLPPAWGTPHYANLVRDHWLEDTFHGRVISCEFQGFWSPVLDTSLDLNPT